MKSKKTKWSMLALMAVLIIGIVLWLIPLGSLGAEPVPTGWQRIQGGDGWSPTDVTINVDEECEITKIMIKSGAVAGKSGEITSDGSYGHFVLWNTEKDKPDNSKEVLSGHKYVTSGDDIVDDSKTYKWVGAYIVSGLGSDSVNIEIVTEYGNIIQDMSHVDYYVKCEGTGQLTGCIRIYKNLSGEGAGDVTGNFEFKIYDNPEGNGDPVATASIHFENGVADPNYADVCGLELKSYWVKETQSPDSKNVTPGLLPGGFLEVYPCAAANSSDASIERVVPSCEVTFVNDPGKTGDGDGDGDGTAGDGDGDITTTTSPPPPAGEVEVEGIIEVLPMTGTNMMLMIFGIVLIVIGAAFGGFYLQKSMKRR